MSLTSYRAAPPRGRCVLCLIKTKERLAFVPTALSSVLIVLGLCSVLGRPGSDLLSHTLRCSTIGAVSFHGRVRDGIGCFRNAITTRSSKDRTPRSMI